MINEEKLVWLVYETVVDTWADVENEDVVRRVFSFMSDAQNFMANQVDPTLWWMEEWTVDEDL